MQQDEEGFFYPRADKTNCIECGLCERVCPILAPMREHAPLRVFAAQNSDEEIRRNSSSGGIFTILAENVIREGGLVFGARWNKDWNVEHTYVDSVEGLKEFRGSKYVQSDINGSYHQTEAFLKDGRKVLFSGTPCQVAGLKSFLRKEYDNLLTVECACHGVPSPGLWQKYLVEETKGKSVVSINHRDKRTGWRTYSVVIKFADGKEIAHVHDENSWIRAFLKDLTLRPSCYTCAFKIPNTSADITISDLWGDTVLSPETALDNKGITSIIIHTRRGQDLVDGIKASKELSLDEIKPFNPSLVEAAKYSSDRTFLYSGIFRGKSFKSMVWKVTKDPFILRMKIRIARMFYLLGTLIK